jgi:hypothetical protein
MNAAPHQRELVASHIRYSAPLSIYLRQTDHGLKEAYGFSTRI